MLLKHVLLVGLGGAIGSILRFAVALLVRNQSFPYATLIVNLLGSFAIGIIIGLHSKTPPALNDQSRLFLATGLCGGFTTFSAFALENLQLLKSANYFYFFLYVGVTIVIGIFATYLGFLAVK